MKETHSKPGRSLHARVRNQLISAGRKAVLETEVLTLPAPTQQETQSSLPSLYHKTVSILKLEILEENYLGGPVHLVLPN